MEICCKKNNKRWRLLSALLLILLLVSEVFADSSYKHFPEFSSISPNVKFWHDIYEKYSTSQAVLHDKKDLTKIYAVIPIIDHRLPVASRLNKPVLKTVKAKYKKILKKLARGESPDNTEERRLAAMFKGKSKKIIQQSANSLRIQIGQKERFREGVTRSGAYIRDIKRIFISYDLPEKLAYLPHVESSFNTRAHSKHGASGIWQFTRHTGRNYLRIDYTLDERQDPILASHAAAKFLKKNYELLGSWPLAITAYNYGPAGMQRAKKAKGSYEKIFSGYNKGRFKFASRNFYSEFLAALSVARTLEENKTVKRTLPLEFNTLKLPGFISLADISHHFNIDPTSIKKLNPALLSPVLKGKKHIPKGYILRLPATTETSRLLATLPDSLFKKKQRPDRYYRVKAGDTAGEIAKKHRVSLDELKKLNKLNNKATVYTGQRLRIPDGQNKKKPLQTLRSGEKNSSLSLNHKSKQKQNLPVLRSSKKKRVTSLPRTYYSLYSQDISFICYQS